MSEGVAKKGTSVTAGEENSWKYCIMISELTLSNLTRYVMLFVFAL